MGDVQRLAVNEIFGPTFQGEGARIGVPTMFLRLAGCNLACVWCDTPYAWDWKRFKVQKESHMIPVRDILIRLRSASVKSLVISGGEPMLQQKALTGLTRQLHAEGWTTEIETAGTITPDSVELVKHWTVSPKLSTSGNTLEKRYNAEALEKINYAPRRAFKFVVTGLQDFPEIDAMVNELGLQPVYIMPEGITEERIIKVTKVIAPHVIDRGYNLTTRLQVLAYGQRRAV